MLRDGRADAVLVVKLDRLTRSVRDLGSLVENYFREGLPWSLLSVGDSIDTRTASGRLVLNVLGSVGQWEREAGSERTKEALAQVRSEGFMLGRLPYGFRYADTVDQHGRRAVTDAPAEAATVTRMRELAAAGRSIYQIATEMNAEGHRNRAGKPWHPTTVYGLLRRRDALPHRRAWKRRARHPEAAPLAYDSVRAAGAACALRAAGMSFRQIGRALLAQGIPPHGGGAVWYASTVQRLIARSRRP